MIGDLTAREVEVCVQIIKGLPQKDIAVNLKIARATVKHHVVNIGNKLGMPDDGKKLLVTIFVAKTLMQAAREYPLIAAALEL